MMPQRAVPYLFILIAALPGCVTTPQRATQASAAILAAEAQRYEPTDLTLGLVPTCASVDSEPEFDTRIRTAVERYGIFKTVGQASSMMDKSFDLIAICSQVDTVAPMVTVVVISAYSQKHFASETSELVTSGLTGIKTKPFDVRKLAYATARAFVKGSPGYNEIHAEREAHLGNASKSPVVRRTAAAPAQVRSDVDNPAYRLPERPNDFAMIVGIEDYAGLPKADFADRDAQAVRRHLLALGYPERNVIFLAGQQASKTSIEKYVESWLPRNVAPDSRVLVYFSGHGAPVIATGEAHLIPWDGDPSFLENTGYPVKRLYEKLASLRAKEVVVAMDACFSGAGGRSVLAKGARPLVTKVEEALAPRNLTVFAAASGDQITSTLEDQGHGAFTYYFLKGLSGAAKDASGAVTAKGLYDYLKPKVQDAARRQNRDQEPVLRGDDDRELVRF